MVSSLVLGLGGTANSRTESDFFRLWLSTDSPKAPSAISRALVDDIFVMVHRDWREKLLGQTLWVEQLPPEVKA